MDLEKFFTGQQPEIVDKVMVGFEEIWPKIIWLDPQLEPYHDLLAQVYAEGATNVCKYLSKHIKDNGKSEPPTLLH